MTVILTMTTVPDRLIDYQDRHSLQRCLDRLLNQSYGDYELHFNIPSIHSKTGRPYNVPRWLYDLNDPKFKLYTNTEDYGPITKIVPTLQRVNDPNAIIITVDDDLEYMDGFIEYHLEKRKQYPNAALGFAGIGAVDGSTHYATTVRDDIQVKVLEHYKTVSYLRSFFEDDFFTDFVGKHWADDIVLSAYMGKQNISKIVLAYDKDTDFSPRVQSFPVVDHLPFEWGGCNIYRQENDENSGKMENEYYRIGYLER